MAWKRKHFTRFLKDCCRNPWYSFSYFLIVSNLIPFCLALSIFSFKTPISGFFLSQQLSCSWAIFRFSCLLQFFRQSAQGSLLFLVFSSTYPFIFFFACSNSILRFLS